MLCRASLCIALLAVLFGSGVEHAQAARKPHHYRVGLILHDNVLVRAKPDSRSQVMAALVEQTQVVVLGHRGPWDRVSIWASTHGWVPREEVGFRRPWHRVSTYRAPEIHYHVQAHPARALNASGLVLAAAPVRKLPGGQPLQSLPARTSVKVSGWQQDSTGNIWYRVSTGWIVGDAVQFRWSTSPKSVAEPQSNWRRVTGKGMWLTLGPNTGGSAATIVRAAQHNGVTHLYVEAAISPLGFHGRSSLGPLIDAAHRSHVAIIAWVYPYLYDIAADVALTREVAQYRTSIGNGFDGIAADLERNAQLSTVRSYSQIVRAYLGSAYLLVGVTYPPQSSPGYPFAEAANDYDVLAPMDYWHETKTANGLNYGHLAYGREYGYRYAVDSVRGIRAAGVRIPVAPIGQVFDDFGRLEMGPYAPSADEIRGFLVGSKDSGAIGVSFFQWMTATVDEWRVIRDYRY